MSQGPILPLNNPLTGRNDPVVPEDALEPEQGPGAGQAREHVLHHEASGGCAHR